MTTSDSSLVCDFDENLLLAQLNELITDDIDTVDETNFFKNVEQLLISFYDLNSTEDKDFDSDFARALFRAVDVGHLNVLIWLKEHGFDLMVKTMGYYTILHQAAKNGHREIVEWLEP